MAERLVLGDGFTIRFTAVDPSTGNPVTGVTVTNVNIDGDAQGTEAQPVELTPGPYMLVPGPNA